jgi:hypothetical protein
MTGIDKLHRESVRLIPAGALSFQRERLAHRTPSPSICRSIGFLMREERVHHYAQLLTLAGHDVDGIVQKRAADLRSRFRHENLRARLPPHQHRQGTDVIEVRMRNDDGVERAIVESAEVRQ